MTISFNNISQSDRASNIDIEIAGVLRSAASFFIPPTPVIIGQYDPLKTGIVDYELVKVSSKEAVGDIAGWGSHLHRQALAFPNSVFNSGGGVYIAPIPDAVGAVAATETITFAVNATKGGTFYFSFGGELVRFNVKKDDTPTIIGDALEDAIDSNRNIAVTAINAIGVVTITSKFKGTEGNKILIKQNPGGEVQAGESPGGTTVVIENVDGYLAGGTGTPDIHDIFFDSGEEDKLGDRWYTQFTCPFNDATNLGIIKDAGDARSAPTIHRMFGAYTAYVDKTYDEALAIPATINSEWIGTVWAARGYYPEFEYAAALAGRIAQEQNLNPARPYKTTDVGLSGDTTIPNVNYGSQDALFKAGMGFIKIGNDGVMRWGDIPLTYRKTPTGADTEEWFDAVSLHSRQAKAYSLEQIFSLSPYDRGVVVDNNAITNVEWAISPKDVIADLSKLIEDLWGPFAWTKNVEEVIEGLTSDINESFQGRIDAQVTDDEAKALRIIALKYAFLY